MAQPKPVEPVKLICGIIAADDEVLAVAKQELEQHLGPVDGETDVVPFDFTEYYREEMGDGLLRQLVSFERRIDPATLADVKLLTNRLELDLAVDAGERKARRVNLDPGYVTGTALVLATVKNQPHRIYLRDGIYAEVTLRFRKNKCIYSDWTYPDFKSGRYAGFLLGVRNQRSERPTSNAQRPTSK